MTSTRLPGKVLKDVAGRPMLAQQIRRLKQCACLDDIVIASTENAADDPIVQAAAAESVGCFRGSEQDVLSRVVGAAEMARADVVVRLTADCPLIDAGVVDKVVRVLMDSASECDYASNIFERTYPRGLDAEAMFVDTLKRMDRLATSKPAREHVTVYIRSERRDLFLVRSVKDIQDNSDLRWTVDTQADLDIIREIYTQLELSNRALPYTEILAYVRAHPELISIDEEGRTWDPTKQAR